MSFLDMVLDSGEVNSTTWASCVAQVSRPDTDAKTHFYQSWPKSDSSYGEKKLKRATHEAQVRVGPSQKYDLGHDLSAGFF
jgi:hypothetical protein